MGKFKPVSAFLLLLLQLLLTLTYHIPLAAAANQGHRKQLLQAGALGSNANTSGSGQLPLPGATNPTNATAANATGTASNASTGSRVPAMLKSVFDFWLQHGPDPVYGGFHGTLDREGRPIPPYNKSIIQQARHVWSFSTLYSAVRSNSSLQAVLGYDPNTLKATADNTYNFIRSHLVQATPDNGTLFVYEVAAPESAYKVMNATGSLMTNTSINLMANAFGILGLAAYARATNNSDALGLALSTFETVDRLYHSPLGGYDESTTNLTFGNVPLSNASSNSSSSSSSNATSVSLSQSSNTLMNLAIALTELSRATNGSNANVTARLLELTQLLTGPLIIRNASGVIDTSSAFPTPYLRDQYDPRGWTPVGSKSVNFGMNIEAAWNLAEAVSELQARGALEAANASAMNTTLRDLATAAVRAGYDNTNGGMYEGTDLLVANITKPSKVWWIQAEAMLGLQYLFNVTNGETDYLNKLYQTLFFVANNLWDQQYGEWYWSTGPAGGPPTPFESGDVRFNATVKGTTWKASYHTGRVMLRLWQAGY